MRSLAWSCLLPWLLACSRSEPAPPQASSSSASASATFRTAALEVTSDVASAGLRVRSGTLPAPSAAAVAAPWGFSDLEPDAARTRLEIALVAGGAELSRLLPPGGLAVVNGGYFEADFRPSTWVVSGGVPLANKSDTTKGGVLALAGGQSYIGPFAGLGFQPELAVQSFPMIVEPDGTSGIHRDDGRRAARTVACLVGGALHLIVITAPRGEGPTLFEAAGVLRAPPPLGFGCRAALNLDGGPSSGVWFAPELGARQRPPLARVAYALAVLPAR